ncbi:MAG: hypothetical protein EHM64_15685 [Ignavibacteriae bacterium]|nr:MAG: hypothetical protein EHM64_15685 [Ignavibacteriota bacterium]
MKKFQFVFPFLFFFIMGTTGFALPRFAAATNLKCGSCHIDPNGGGMRNYYGAAMWGRGTLPVRAWSQDSTMMDFTPRLNDFVSIGMDMQTLFYHQPQQKRTSFYQMQGNIYLTARLANKLLLYFNKGLYGFDVFGIAYVLPANGYIKAGRFTPAYGTMIDDHTTFIRTKTVFPLYRRDDTGIELGISPSFLSWNVGVYNGEEGADPSNGNVRLFTSRAEALFRLADVNVSLGGSTWFNKGLAGSLTMYSGFVGMGYKDLTVHGEVDLKKNIAGLGTKEFITYLEVNYLLFDGLALKLLYDFYDPDMDLVTGSETRYSIGAEFFPLPGVEVRPMVRFHSINPGNVQQNEIDILMHLFI